MANQNPQPEIYSTRHSFTAADTQGTTVTQTVYTNQANTEEVRIYAVSVQMIDTSGGLGAATLYDDFEMRIQIGQSYVPFQPYDAGLINGMGERTLTFATPILVLFQQPISIEIEWRNSTALAANTTVKVSLHAELALQTEYPHNNGQPNYGRNY
jgi:hypothetical protein|tara:strand:+ start:4013 stop:4477 length:465 start_codon:yes stop_codon:yes gene_type:complete